MRLLIEEVIRTLGCQSLTLLSCGKVAKIRLEGLIVLDLLNLAHKVLEHRVCAQIVELPQSCVHALRVVKRHASVAVGLESALWLAFEDERVEAGRIHVRLLGHLAIVDAVVKEALFAVNHGTQVSRLANLVYQPLQDRNYVLVVKTLDLVREDLSWTLHHLKRLHHLFAELDLLAKI